jgi:hypothetical protein
MGAAILQSKKQGKKEEGYPNTALFRCTQTKQEGMGVKGKSLSFWE